MGGKLFDWLTDQCLTLKESEWKFTRDYIKKRKAFGGYIKHRDNKIKLYWLAVREYAMQAKSKLYRLSTSEKRIDLAKFLNVKVTSCKTSRKIRRWQYLVDDCAAIEKQFGKAHGPTEKTNHPAHSRKP